MVQLYDLRNKDDEKFWHQEFIKCVKKYNMKFRLEKNEDGFIIGIPASKNANLFLEEWGKFCGIEPSSLCFLWSKDRVEPCDQPFEPVKIKIKDLL